MRANRRNGILGGLTCLNPHHLPGLEGCKIARQLGAARRPSPRVLAKRTYTVDEMKFAAVAVALVALLVAPAAAFTPAGTCTPALGARRVTRPRAAPCGGRRPGAAAGSSLWTRRAADC